MQDTQDDIHKSVFKYSLAPSIIVKADPPRFTILSTNDQHKKATNTSDRNLIGLSLWEAFDPKDKRGNYEWHVIVKGLEQSMRQKKVVKLPDFRYDILSADGKSLDESYWKVEIIPVIKSYNVESLMAITHNVTQQKLIEKSLSRCLEEKKNLDKQRDDFISIASHELRTPLTALKVNLELMDVYKKDCYDENTLSLLKNSNKCIKKLSELIEDLLHTTVIKDGNLSLNLRSFKLSDAIDTCCHPIRLLNKYNVTMEGDLSLSIEADEERISQVISNMVDNAIKHSPDTKDIIISISRLENKAMVAVKDMGRGIDKEHLPHIFKKYYRADSTGVHAGMGLGLYISSEIIKKHGGEIGVKSEPEKGSNFWFTIPFERTSLS